MRVRLISEVDGLGWHQPKGLNEIDDGAVRSPRCVRMTDEDGTSRSTASQLVRFRPSELEGELGVITIGPTVKSVEQYQFPLTSRPGSVDRVPARVPALETGAQTAAREAEEELSSPIGFLNIGEITLNTTPTAPDLPRVDEGSWDVVAGCNEKILVEWKARTPRARA